MKKKFMLDAYREGVATEISRLLPILLREYHAINPISEQFQKRIEAYILGGKLIRGSLLPFAYNLLPGRDISETDLYSLAAALELFQSMLLIHDDIMDKDELRRGGPAMHAIYNNDGRISGVEDFRVYGESMGICCGDIVTFMAFAVISRLDCDGEIIRILLQIITRELTLVGLAQMQDVRNGYLPSNVVSVEDVINTYRHKTGRYTFSLPLSLAALLRAVDDDLRKSLECFGELLGVVFQIKDDEIGLFGDPALIGKPNDSDLSEGKKTIFVQRLMQCLDSDGRVELTRILRNYQGEKDLQWVKSQMEHHSVQGYVSEIVQEYLHRCSSIIKLLPYDSLVRGLNELMDYNLGRMY